jgi:hypothetical protein
MTGACSMHERDEKCILYFGWKKLKGRAHLKDIGIHCKIILEWISGK